MTEAFIARDRQQISGRETVLESFGDLLPNYASLHAEYSAKVHQPDFLAFSEQWEESLYRPVRDAVRTTIRRADRDKLVDLLYCAPGHHAPLLKDDNESGLASRFDRITLLDIDRSALSSARKTLRSLNSYALIETIPVDFSGPFGQRLCDCYVDSLWMTESPTEVAERLSEQSNRATEIFFDADRVVAELSSYLDIVPGGRRYSLVVSEMVSTFTGTPVWLAFRSALYDKFSGRASRGEIEKCLAPATELWQKYNEYFLGAHLDCLLDQTATGGRIVLVFDTRKVYADLQLGSMSTFTQAISLSKIMAVRQLRILDHSVLSWLDHPRGFDVSIYGTSIPDFQPHTHDVELYVLEVAS